eukprot:3369856-Prorocentrum_lima.AAC.1
MDAHTGARMRAPRTWPSSGSSEEGSCGFGHETHAQEAPTPCSWSTRGMSRCRAAFCYREPSDGRA